MAECHPGRQALQHTARVLAQKPKTDGDELSRASRCLGAFRAELIARESIGATGDHDRLARLNAIISVVMGMHFPLGHAPWDEFAKAQAWLQDLVAEVEGTA